MMRASMRCLGWVVLAMLALGGCEEAIDRPARWSYIHAAIIQPACTTSGCHSAHGSIAGTPLYDRDGAYAVLTGRVCGEPERETDPGRNHVTPYSSEYSTLMYQLRGEDSGGRPVRDVMPPDTPLPDVEIELIARWIDEGAPCN